MGSTILVLEDDANLREIIVESLEDDGFTVISAGDPDAAIEKARRQKFQLALFDIRMAGSTDGIGALEIIKKLQPGLRTIVMTGFASLEAPARAAHIAADDYLLKGDKNFGVKELLRVVHAVLERGVVAPLSWWQRLLAAPSRARQASEQAALMARLPPLEENRRAVFSYLYLYIRSSHIPPDIFWQFWQRLIPLEVEYLDLTSSAAIAPLQLKYAGLAAGLQTLNPPPLELHPIELTKQQVYQLYERVRQGLIEGWQFEQSTTLWLNLESRRESPSNYVLFHVLWGQASDLQPDFFPGKTLGQQTRVSILRRISSAGNVQRFEGKLESNGQTVIVEMLPRSSELDAALGRAQLDPQTLSLELLDSHLLVIRRPATESDKLESQLSGQECLPAQAIGILAPVFKQVLAGHERGIFDGCLGPHRIYTTAFGGQLDSLGPQRFQKLLGTQAGLNLLSFAEMAHLAPEIRSAPRPTALTPQADQYCLGSLLTQVLLGLPSRQYLSLLLEAPKTPAGSPHFGLAQRHAQWTRIEPALHRMMAAKPTDRYPSLADAMDALRTTV